MPVSTYTLDAQLMVKYFGGARQLARLHGAIAATAGFKPFKERSINSVIRENNRDPSKGFRASRILELRTIADALGLPFDIMQFCSTQPLLLPESVLKPLGIQEKP